MSSGPAEPLVGFTPDRGWLNDPHGVTYRQQDGLYHLFFQRVADSLTWQPQIAWGHAVSPDLSTWTQLPDVLAPDGQDLGCWSGCLVDDGSPRIFYTSVAGEDPLGWQLGRIRCAVPDDESWRTWRKLDWSLSAPTGLTAFRDPSVMREGEGWRMLVGVGLDDGSGGVVSFTSTDLEHWEYDGLAASRSPTALDAEGCSTGSIWECPQLVEVDGRWAMLVSVWDQGETVHVVHALGEWLHGRFDAGPWRQLVSPPAYASTTFRDARGRPAVMSWLRGVADPKGRWRGALSRPALLRVLGDRLVLEPWSG